MEKSIKNIMSVAVKGSRVSIFHNSSGGYTVEYKSDEEQTPIILNSHSLSSAFDLARNFLEEFEPTQN